MKKFSTLLARRYLLSFFLAASLALSAFQEQQQAGGIPPWVWILLIGVLILLIAWWIFRASQRSTGMPPRRMEVASPPAVTAPDDLTIIEGIGPKIAEILKSAGITTFNQLADTDVQRLRSILDEGGIRLADPRSWAEQARLAAAGDHAGLRALQDRLTAGRES